MLLCCYCKYLVQFLMSGFHDSEVGPHGAKEPTYM